MAERGRGPTTRSIPAPADPLIGHKQPVVQIEWGFPNANKICFRDAIKKKKFIFSDFVRKREGGSRTKPTFLVAHSTTLYSILSVCLSVMSSAVLTSDAI